MNQGMVFRMHDQPSRNRWNLAKHEREIIARALVDYAATIPPEWAFAYPRWMYEIAAKLDITERLKAYAHSLDERDAAKISAKKESRIA